jgi:hypothetical protein
MTISTDHQNRLGPVGDCFCRVVSNAVKRSLFFFVYLGFTSDFGRQLKTLTFAVAHQSLYILFPDQSTNFFALLEFGREWASYLLFRLRLYTCQIGK